MKTGIAVALALYISGLLQLNGPVIAAVAAIFALQPTIYRSWRYIWEQLQTNTLGAALAMGAGMFFSKDPIAIGLVCILVIMVCLKMKMEETVGLTLVTVVAVMEASGDWVFALNRFSLILIGIGAAFLINIAFFPPKPELQFAGQIQSVFGKLSLLLKTVISNELKEAVFRDEKKALGDALKGLEAKYGLLEEENNKLKLGQRFSQIRRLVVYKQMLKALSKGYEVLEAIDEHYFQARRSGDTDAHFDAHLELLIKFHEHVMLKFDNKLKAEDAEGKRVMAECERFMNLVIDRYVQNREGKMRLSVVAAAMFDYGHQTVRLGKLVDRHNREHRPSSKAS